MKKLRLKIDAMIMSECWTYFKMAIIETSQYKKAWLATHFRLFSYHNFSVIFGENGRMHPLSYFEDILSIKEIPIGQVNNTNLIDILINEINDGNYITLDCNYPKIYDDTSEYFDIHEVYLFGFDEKRKVFYATGIQNSGRFGEVEIPFSRLQAAYADLLYYYSQHPEKMVERRCFFFNISSIKLQDGYNDDNSIYLFLQKIQDELHGAKHIALFYNKDGQLPTTSAFFCNEEGKVSETGEYYTGLACLLMIREDIGTLLSNFDMSKNLIDELIISLKKIHEHQTIIQLSLEWFIEKLAINDHKFINMIHEYKICCENMKQMYLMALKLKMTHNKSLLKELHEQLLLLYKKEYKCLSQFEGIAKQYYYKNQGKQLQ